MMQYLLQYLESKSAAESLANAIERASGILPRVEHDVQLWVVHVPTIQDAQIACDAWLVGYNYSAAQRGA